MLLELLEEALSRFEIALGTAEPEVRSSAKFVVSTTRTSSSQCPTE